jgi:hypothetical protein
LNDYAFELGLNGIFLGLNGIDFLGFLGLLTRSLKLKISHLTGFLNLLGVI